MKLIGLTGGVGMGKSTAAGFLRRRGLPIIDTDEVARQLVEPGQPALEEIRLVFGCTVIDPQGRLRREVLGRMVFADESQRRRLEAILHPRIRTQWQDEAAKWRVQGVTAAVVVIPLLYETGAEAEVDFVLCMACRPETQRRRLSDRGWSEQEIKRRNQAQWPVETKMGRADFVVWNECSLDVQEDQLERILASIAAGTP